MGRRFVAVGAITAGIVVLTAGPATAATPDWEVLATPNPRTGHNVFADVSGVSGADVWGFFGPELTPPTDVDEQTRMLAFLGRAACNRWGSRGGRCRTPAGRHRPLPRRSFRRPRLRNDQPQATA